MEIMGIGPLEVLFILLIALIAVGPKDLGKAARSMGRLLNQLYKSEAWQNLGEASRSIRTLPNRLAREAALEELAQVKREMEEGVTSGMDQIKNFDLEADQPSLEGDSPSPDESNADPQMDTALESGQSNADLPKDAEPTKDQPEDTELTPDQPTDAEPSTDQPLESPSPEEK